MDMLLLGITAVSLVAAAISTTVAWQVTRADQRRRAARIEALAVAAGVPAVVVRPVVDEVREARGADAGHGVVDGASAAATRTGLLSASVSDSGSGGRQRTLMGGAAAFATVLIGVVGVWMFGQRAPGVAEASPRVPLELVSLSHSRADGAFAVSGLVRNPEVGGAVRELEADVRVFDAAGIMIATTAAKVDVAELTPGQESPFVLTLGEATTAARYRVSFKSGGTMVPHVDKRVSVPSAVSQTADAR